MKTAVNQMIKELQEQFPKEMGDMYERNQLLLEDIALRAKEMEDNQKKELVVATYTYLKMKDCHLPYGMEYLNKISELDDEAEQFYNETFKK